VDFNATAYCQHGKTRSGVGTRRGIAAADPRLLPVGSVVRLDSSDTRYDGIYTVMDTGSKVQGRHIDIFLRDCQEATEFGRQSVTVQVLRLGWNPKASAPAPALAVTQLRPGE
jgi:3D (Asp-Asp-Asp) domain-containing protein